MQPGPRSETHLATTAATRTRDPVADDRCPTRPTARHRDPVQHVVCFEEAGDCTLERIAREAMPGDSVLALGPEQWALRLRELGLHGEIAITSIGRTGGGYPRVRSSIERASAVAHGRFAAVIAGTGGPSVPAELPTAPSWPDGRRARIRRELGLAVHERGVLVTCEPGEWAELGFALRAIAMARVAGSALRPVVSPKAPRRAVLEACLVGGSTSSSTSSSSSSSPIVIVDGRCDRPWELLPALDLAVFDQDGLPTHPPACLGWRAAKHRGIPTPAPASPLPALWSLACGVPALVHDSIDLGPHARHPLVVRFGADVAQLARELHARASSASAASR